MRASPDPIRAAGGVLLRRSPSGIAVCVLRRLRHGHGRGDLVLPKGKQEPGESDEQTALREVEEESGCRGRITGPGHVVEYQIGGLPKRVVYFPMEFLGDGGTPDPAEVREVLWLSPADALRLLDYDGERAALRAAVPGL